MFNRFSMAPSISNVPRSVFNRNSTHKTSFNVGQLIPIYCDEVLPGDTFQMRTNFVLRASTPINPVMDQAFLDIYYFFVPNRILWKNWKSFMGENTKNKWYDKSTTYSLPKLTFNKQTNPYNSIADYFGIPVGNDLTISVNHLPFRAYAKIVNEWFRDQNNEMPLLEDDSNASYSIASHLTDTADRALKGGKPYIVNKYHDYFTSCLPSPQKGDDVKISVSADVPVVSGTDHTESQTQPLRIKTPYNENVVLGFGKTGGDGKTLGTWSHGSVYAGPAFKDLRNVTIKNANFHQGGVQFQNMWAKTSNLLATSINDLRLAFALQRLFEKDARSGTRYTEIIQAHFGVRSPDARQQRPEYLGGSHTPLNQTQIAQTSSTDNTSPQGNVSAFSLTADSRSSFTKSFTEHGFVIGLACVRTRQTYNQGIEKFWLRTTRTDFYLPVLANIGEQPVDKVQLYALHNQAEGEVFGYQEAWAEYRYKISHITGRMRTLQGGLSNWHYGINFNSLPVLSESFIKQGQAEFDRSLAVKASANTPQLIMDLAFFNKTSRPMPLYSVPGKLDMN